jgi:3-carboxy-cis,cis-muconate cycloisomerase
MSLPQSLHGALFGDPALLAWLSDRARVQALLDCELALAEAQAELGVVPERCPAALAKVCRTEELDLDALRAEAASAGNLVIPLVRQLTRRVAEVDADAARFVHWGATSQDIADTGLVLQLRGAAPLVLGHLQRAARAAARLAERHASTPMVGRTWLQHAGPITFGLKAAGWLDALGRAQERAARAFAGTAVLQLGGATGTLASLAPAGPAVAAALARRLGLELPALPWHTQRDRLVELACALGLAIGALGKLARDLALLAQTEVGEVQEPAAPGHGGSSSMPHKHNPVSASVAASAALRAPGLVATLLHAMAQEHERAIGGWQAEWETLPELVMLAGGSARASADALEGLQVDTARMRANLDLTQGRALSEAVAQRLAQSLGRAPAHERVAAACERALREGRSLLDVLRADAQVAAVIPPDELAALLDPERQLGAAAHFVARALARWRSQDSDA